MSENTTVGLNGEGVDPDQSSRLSYLWKQIDGGPAVKLSNSSSANPSFVTPIVPSNTNLKFSLVVKDDKGAVSKNLAIVTITVKHINQPPIANAGPNQIVTENTTKIVLDGSKSYDPDESIQSYIWRQVSGSPLVKLTGANASKAVFKGPVVSNNTKLTFKLTVIDNDRANSSASTNVLVRHIDIPPIARRWS